MSDKLNSVIPNILHTVAAVLAVIVVALLAVNPMFSYSPESPKDAPYISFKGEDKGFEFSVEEFLDNNLELLDEASEDGKIKGEAFEYFVQAFGSFAFPILSVVIFGIATVVEVIKSAIHIVKGTSFPKASGGALALTAAVMFLLAPIMTKIIEFQTTTAIFTPNFVTCVVLGAIGVALNIIGHNLEKKKA